VPLSGTDGPGVKLAAGRTLAPVVHSLAIEPNRAVRGGRGEPARSRFAMWGKSRLHASLPAWAGSGSLYMGEVRAAVGRVSAVAERSLLA
jgi:hypothetical protein